MPEVVHLIAAARPNFMKVAPLWRALQQYPERFDPRLIHTGQHYDRNMSDVFFADLGLPRPHHHLGVGSGTHAEQTAGVMTAYEKLALAERPGAQGATEGFVRQLGWREFAHHLLHHYPHTATAPLDARFERFPWQPNAAWLEAWQRGRTGYPIVDAGMRQLLAEGWMHNRVRMITASFLTKDLHLWWPLGAKHFLDHLIDGQIGVR